MHESGEGEAAFPLARHFSTTCCLNHKYRRNLQYRPQQQGPSKSHNGSENVTKEGVFDWFNSFARVIFVHFIAKPMQKTMYITWAYFSFDLKWDVFLTKLVINDRLT